MGTASPMGIPLLPEGALTFNEDENPQDEINRLIDELAWEGVDPDEAKKLLETEILNTPHTSLGEDMAIAATELQEMEASTQFFDPCTDALFDVTVDLIGLVISAKRSQKHSLSGPKKRLNKEVKRIIK